jgi:hypothetical protein
VFLCRGFSSEIFLLFCSCAWIFFVFLVRARFPSWFSRAYGLIPPQIFFTAQGRTTGSLPVRFSVVVFIQPERARGLDSVARFGFPCSCSRVSHRRSFSPSRTRVGRFEAIPSIGPPALSRLRIAISCSRASAGFYRPDRFFFRSLDLVFGYVVGSHPVPDLICCSQFV